jgi:signal transduction histidine kinase
MLIKKFFIIYISLYLPVTITSSSQHNEIDSLKKQLEVVNATQKIEIYNKLSKLHWEISLNTSFEYAIEAHKIAEALGDSKALANTLNRIGDVYSAIEMWGDAIRYYTESNIIIEQEGDEKEMAMSYNNLGTCYFHINNEKESLDFFQKAVDIAEQIQDDSLLASGYLNLGELYEYSEYYDKSIDFLRKSLLLYEEINNSQKYIEVLNIIGNNLKRSGQSLNAIQYFTKSIELSEKLNDSKLLSTTKNLMGNVYMETGNMEKAFTLFKQSLDHARKANDKILINNVYQSFSHYYSTIGDFQNAYRYDTIFYNVNDSLFRVQNEKKIAQLTEFYDTESKDKELAVLKLTQTIESLEIKQKMTFRNFMIVLVTIILLVTIVSLYSLYLKRKTNKVLLVKNIQLQETNLLLVESEKQLKEINDTKNKFFSIIAHDLITPFNALLGFTELLVEEAKSYHKEEIKKYGQFISQSAKKLYQLLENLLQWSRSQRGIIDFHPEFFDLSKTVGNLVTFFELSARKKKISITEDLKGGNLVYADETLVSTIIRNLINNAIKFTNSGGWVKITSKEKDEYIEVAVSDNGIGIKKENIQELFKIDTQYTRNGTSGEHGTGLGLIITREFVEKNGGQIRVESEEQKGSTFIFTLPKKPL